MKDNYVVGKKRPEMIAKVPNAKVVLFISNQSLFCTVIKYSKLVRFQDKSEHRYSKESFIFCELIDIVTS